MNSSFGEHGNKTFLGGSRVIPMNSTMDAVDETSAAFSRFVDKNKVFERERAIAVEQAILGANKRYIVNVGKAKEQEASLEEKMEIARQKAVLKMEEERRRNKDKLTEISRFNLTMHISHVD